MVVEVLWFCGQIVFFSIIFGLVDRIGDWTKWEVVLLVGTHQIIAQLFQAFFFVNVANIPELVRTGRLDSLLVLPIDSQFAVSTKQFGLDSVINALLGGVVVVVSLITRLGPDPAPFCSIWSRSDSESQSIIPSCCTWRDQLLDRAGPGTGLRIFQFPQHRALSGRDLSARLPLIFSWIIPVVIVANIPARMLVKSLGQPPA